MKHEKLGYEYVTRVLFPRNAPFEANQTAPAGRPRRVLPLALGAILLAIGMTEGMSRLLSDVTDHEYASQTIRETLKTDHLI
jgi:hypothetical protein